MKVKCFMCNSISELKDEIQDFLRREVTIVISLSSYEANSYHCSTLIYK